MWPILLHYQGGNAATGVDQFWSTSRLGDRLVLEKEVLRTRKGGQARRRGGAEKGGKGVSVCLGTGGVGGRSPSLMGKSPSRGKGEKRVAWLGTGKE